MIKDEYTDQCEDFEVEPVPTSGLKVKHTSASMWSQHDDVFVACDKALEHLPAGYYIVDSNSQLGYFLRKKELSFDGLIDGLNDEMDYIMYDIERFLNAKAKYTKYGFLWKRGYLMYGAPGTGKTSLIQNVAKKFFERGGIVLFATQHTQDSVGCLEMIRRLEPNRPILYIMEEIEQLLRQGDEHKFLSILDGELQVDNIVTIATTNYPELLDARVINRPSRFDIVQSIPYPSYEARLYYLKCKIPESADVEESELERWAELTENMGFAHLKELIAGVLILEKDAEDVINRLQSMEKGNFSSDNDKESNFGFTPPKLVVKAIKEYPKG